MCDRDDRMSRHQLRLLVHQLGSVLSAAADEHDPACYVNAMTSESQPVCDCGAYSAWQAYKEHVRAEGRPSPTYTGEDPL